MAKVRWPGAPSPTVTSVVVRAAEARYRGDNRRCPGRKNFGVRPVPATTAQLIQAHPPLDRRQAVLGGELQDAVPGDALQDGAQTRVTSSPSRVTRTRFIVPDSSNQRCSAPSN